MVCVGENVNVEARVREPCISRMHRSAAREGSQGKSWKLAGPCGWWCGRWEQLTGEGLRRGGGPGSSDKPFEASLALAHEGTLCILSLPKAAICLHPLVGGPLVSRESSGGQWWCSSLASLPDSQEPWPLPFPTILGRTGHWLNKPEPGQSHLG